MANSELLSLAKILLPEVLINNFELIDHKIQSERIDFYFSEYNNVPYNYSGNFLSKGFYKEATIQDFPIRGKEVYLHIKRRRWQDKDTGAIIQRKWDLVSKGTRITKEFADFLKEIYQ
jgi:hypothetical protein